MEKELIRECDWAYQSAYQTTDDYGGSALSDADAVEGTETNCVHQLGPWTR